MGIDAEWRPSFGQDFNTKFVLLSIQVRVSLKSQKLY